MSMPKWDFHAIKFSLPDENSRFRLAKFKPIGFFFSDQYGEAVSCAAEAAGTAY